MDEQVKVRHILIAVSSQDPKADAAAKSKAQSILDQLHHGADFARLAKRTPTIRAARRRAASSVGSNTA